MDQIVTDDSESDRRGRLLAEVRAILPEISALAVGRDAEAAFPATECSLLADCGAFAAPVPKALGGLGMGTDSDAASATMDLLVLVGRASLPLGRVFEGHVNAIRLICRLGTHEQGRQAAHDARCGQLHSVWNTDPANTPLQLGQQGLSGSKILASAAGHATRALVTAGSPRQLLLVRLSPGERADLSGWTAQGMRPSATGRLDFDGIGPDQIQSIGGPDEYLGQPDFGRCLAGLRRGAGRAGCTAH